MPRQKLTQRTDGYFKVKYHDKQFYGKTQAEAMKARMRTSRKSKWGSATTSKELPFWIMR